MNELVAQYPFYYAANLDMPQWEAKHCPLCRQNTPLLSWKDMPEI
jgi:orotate phosphoribosyltransferase